MRVIVRFVIFGFFVIVRFGLLLLCFFNCWVMWLIRLFVFIFDVRFLVILVIRLVFFLFNFRMIMLEFNLFFSLLIIFCSVLGLILFILVFNIFILVMFLICCSSLLSVLLVSLVFCCFSFFFRILIWLSDCWICLSICFWLVFSRLEMVLIVFFVVLI